MRIVRRYSTYWDNLGKKQGVPSAWEKLFTMDSTKNESAHNYQKKAKAERTAAHRNKVLSDEPENKAPAPSEPVLTRTFIHDSLYNPTYGYFSKKAHIFSLPSNIEYHSLKDSIHFQKLIASFYKQEDDDLLEVDDIARQVICPMILPLMYA